MALHQNGKTGPRSRLGCLGPGIVDWFQQSRVVVRRAVDQGRYRVRSEPFWVQPPGDLAYSLPVRQFRIRTGTVAVGPYFLDLLIVSAHAPGKVSSETDVGTDTLPASTDAG